MSSLVFVLSRKPAREHELPAFIFADIQHFTYTIELFLYLLVVHIRELEQIITSLLTLYNGRKMVGLWSENMIRSKTK